MKWGKKRPAEFAPRGPRPNLSTQLARLPTQDTHTLSLSGMPPHLLAEWTHLLASELGKAFQSPIADAGWIAAALLHAHMESVLRVACTLCALCMHYVQAVCTMYALRTGLELECALLHA